LLLCQFASISNFTKFQLIINPAATCVITISSADHKLQYTKQN
jgi:hypothetical protein